MKEDSKNRIKIGWEISGRRRGGIRRGARWAGVSEANRGEPRATPTSAQLSTEAATASEIAVTFIHDQGRGEISRLRTVPLPLSSSLLSTVFSEIPADDSTACDISAGAPGHDDDAATQQLGRAASGGWKSWDREAGRRALAKSKIRDELLEIDAGSFDGLTKDGSFTGFSAVSSGSGRSDDSNNISQASTSSSLNSTKPPRRDYGGIQGSAGWAKISERMRSAPLMYLLTQRPPTPLEKTLPVSPLPTTTPTAKYQLYPALSNRPPRLSVLRVSWPSPP